MSYSFADSLLSANLYDIYCPKYVEFYSKNEFEKLVLLVGFIVRVYHDERSHKRQNICTQEICAKGNTSLTSRHSAVLVYRTSRLWDCYRETMRKYSWINIQKICRFLNCLKYSRLYLRAVQNLACLSFQIICAGTRVGALIPYYHTAMRHEPLTNVSENFR